jgi:hypothetical protein
MTFLVSTEVARTTPALCPAHILTILVVIFLRRHLCSNVQTFTVHQAMQVEVLVQDAVPCIEDLPNAFRPGPKNIYRGMTCSGSQRISTRGSTAAEEVWSHMGMGDRRGGGDAVMV